MAARLDCVVCMIRQALDGARYTTTDEAKQREIVESAMKKVLELGLDAAPAFVGGAIHRLVRELSGNPDPYYAEKKRYDKFALDRYPRFQRWIAESADPFETTVRLATAGNSIDFALANVSEESVDKAIKGSLDQPLSGSIDELRDAIRAAADVLYLTDNAGEIVLDKLLIERLISPEWNKRVTVAVRGSAILNDALMEDAEEVGITALVPTIDNGSDGLGVHFDETSERFNEAFANADLIIAKGLANLESIYFNADLAIKPKKIAFLFKAKCPIIAKLVGANAGDLCVRVAENGETASY